MERSSHSQREKRSQSPRRRKDKCPDKRHHHSSREYDDYPHQESSPHRHKRSHTPRRKRRDERHRQTPLECGHVDHQHQERFTHSDRHGRSTTPRRRRRNEQHNHPSREHDYPHEEISPHRHERRHTPRHKRVEEYSQNSHGYERDHYHHHKDLTMLTSNQHDDIVVWSRQGTYHNSSSREQQFQFSEHQSNSQNMCMGDMRYCACNLCIEGRWRLEGQHHFPSRYSSFSGVECHDDDAYYRHSKLWGDNRRPQTMDDDFIMKTRHLPEVITQYEHQKNDMSSGR